MARTSRRVSTDNENPHAKLTLRRTVLREAFPAGQELKVFDGYHGHGVMWGQLRQEFKARVFGVDVKKLPGVLSMRCSTARTLNASWCS